MDRGLLSLTYHHLFARIPKLILIFVCPQQLFRSQQAAAAGGQAAAAQLQLLQQQQQQQFQLQQQLAAQQAFTQGPYVINAGQEGAPYVSALITGVPPYYGVAAPWGVYPGLVAGPQQQAQQPRRPLTPSQPDQQVNGQGQYVIPYYDPGSLVMGTRNGTPLRLVSPGGVLAPRSYQPPVPAPAPAPPPPITSQSMQQTGKPPTTPTTLYHLPTNFTRALKVFKLVINGGNLSDSFPQRMVMLVF